MTTAAIFDFPTIGKEARLKALEGRGQNVVQPMTVKADPVEFDGYGMYAGFGHGNVNFPDMRGRVVVGVGGVSSTSAGRVIGGSCETVTLAQADLPTVPVVNFQDGYFIFGYDTAPSEYCPPETDPA